jgi:uncharacterized membrane protein
MGETPPTAASKKMAITGLVTGLVGVTFQILTASSLGIGPFGGWIRAIGLAAIVLSLLSLGLPRSVRRGVALASMICGLIGWLPRWSA